MTEVFDNTAVGDTLRQTSTRYAAKLNEVTQTWVIIDLHHESVKSMSLTDNVEDSPAATNLNWTMFETLIREAARLGMLQKYGVSSIDVDKQEDLEAYKGQILNLEGEIKELQEKQEVKPVRSDEFEFRTQALNAVMRLAGMSEISKCKNEKNTLE